MRLTRRTGERSFIAMERLEGQTLRHMIAGKPLEIETVLDDVLESKASTTRVKSKRMQKPSQRVGNS